uniref:Uncharacterized protein n=1 Tax=Noctiluca scintillans TaxID=2966 RepID=A0A7S1ASH3_NOCSC
MWLVAKWFDLLPRRPRGGDLIQECLVIIQVYSISHLPFEAELKQYWISTQCTHLIPGTKADKRPPETGRKRPLREDQQDSAQQQILAHKMALLQKYGMSVQEMAEILEIDESLIENSKDKKRCKLRQTTGNMVAPGNHTLDLNCSLEFLVQEEAAAVVTLELRRSTNASSGAAMGKCSINVKDIDQEPRIEMLTLQGTSAMVKVRMIKHFLVKPKRQRSALLEST